MQFTITAAALMAFAAKALAQVADFDPVLTPTNWEQVSVGDNLKITWQAKPKYSGEKISISLIGGATQNTQTPIKTIATGIDNDAASYSWQIDSSVGHNNVYGLVLKLESNPEVFQYSFPFKIDGGKAEEKPTEKPTEKKPEYEAPTAVETKPAAHVTGYAAPDTTVVAVHETVTVPCNESTPASTFVPVVKTYPAPVPHVPAPVPHNNGTAPTYAAPPAVPTQPAGQPQPPAAATPTPVPVSGAARFGAPVAVVAGLVMAAFAL